MGIKIRAVKIVIKAGSRNFGTEIRFQTKGLTVIRAENTSGKSTIYNSIIYSLGLEVILGVSKHIPLSYIVTDYIPDGDRKLPITESFVLTEIENDSGEIYTVKRLVVTEGDNRLVSLIKGAVITDKNFVPKEVETYYVRYSGSAKNNKGFHTWLASFMGWKLPMLPKYSGGEALLFIECIMPLMIIEQKRGWTHIQSTIPTIFGIRDVRMKSIEFVLKLDSEKIDGERNEIQGLISGVNEKWSENRNRIISKIREINGTVTNLPTAVTPNFAKDVGPAFQVRKEQQWLSLAEKKASLSQEYASISPSQVLSVRQMSEELSAELEKNEEELSRSEDAYRALFNQLNKELGESSLLQKRIETLDHDIAQLEDAHTISKLGGDTPEVSTLDNCPVCSHHLDGSTLSQDVTRFVMDIKSNIEFLKDERKTTKALKDHSSRKIGQLEASISELRSEINNYRGSIRSLKSSLVGDDNSPAYSVIEKKIRIEGELNKIISVDEELRVLHDNLKEVSEEYARLLQKINDLPSRYSETDKDKLNLLENSLKSSLVKFGFKSFEPGELSISEDTLHPMVDEYDWYFESSASDNIRAIWAYTLALVSVANSFSTNHPGLLMFDEPGQHSAHGESLRSFFEKAVTIAGQKAQVIVATSETAENVRLYLQNLPAKQIIFEDGEKIISELS
ncbi:hypothetical protein [Bdellovibrio sp. HCB2-146]|uniref:hypothetical protein n=1 Tax=Bdellovibrio sp. HCB2-146 TaxID=3394362 RepID=UPI0039BCA2A5